MRKLIAETLVALLLGVCLAMAIPQARAADASECVAWWDVSLVARALAITGHTEQASIDVMRHIYGVSMAPGLEATLRAIVVAAQLDRSEAGTFARRIGRACVEAGGDMGRVVGARL